VSGFRTFKLGCAVWSRPALLRQMVGVETGHGLQDAGPPRSKSRSAPRTG
jgi:hypothetical protein